ncbi:MAG: WhiB family transcriptional regulator [Acidimicrobiales bacterium]|jgi:WhiB family redox-sensing transcriptional regulator
MRPSDIDNFAGLSLDGQRPFWQRRAACRGKGSELWFASNAEALDAAKAVCEGCSVRRECLTYALASPDLQGIWAGTDERDRRRMRRASA